MQTTNVRSTWCLAVGSKRISLATLDDQVMVMATDRCTEVQILCKGTGVPVLIDLPATAAAQRCIAADIDLQIAMRMELNHVPTYLQLLGPLEWMREEQLSHDRATGDINRRYCDKLSR